MQHNGGLPRCIQKIIPRNFGNWMRPNAGMRDRQCLVTAHRD
jgi:hypothetical protein